MISDGTALLPAAMGPVAAKVKVFAAAPSGARKQMGKWAYAEMPRYV